MIVAQDVQKDYESKNKYGFKIPITSQALDAILRKTFDIPDGEIERIEVDQERLIVTFYYNSPPHNTSGPVPGRITQAGEYPIRCEVKK